MGLKKKNYFVESLGLTLPDAYAQIREVYLKGESCTAVFYIQKDRESVASFASLEKIHLNLKIDRNKNLLEQAYDRAKKTLFKGWEDDLVIEESEELKIESTEVTEDV